MKEQMSILSSHLTAIDEIKQDIEKESEKVLKAIDLDVMLPLSREEKAQYFKQLLVEFWEAQDDKIKKGIKLGEKRGKALINAIKG